MRSTSIALFLVLSLTTGCATMSRTPNGLLAASAKASPAGTAIMVDASGQYAIDSAQAEVIRAQAAMMRACTADPTRCYSPYGYAVGGINPEGLIAELELERRLAADRAYGYAGSQAVVVRGLLGELGAAKAESAEQQRLRLEAEFRAAQAESE